LVEVMKRDNAVDLTTRALEEVCQKLDRAFVKCERAVTREYVLVSEGDGVVVEL
jgi:hypothetical protein